MAFDTRLMSAALLLPVTRGCVPTRTRIWVLPGARVAGTLRRGPLFAPVGSGEMSSAEPRISITDGVVPVVAEKTVQYAQVPPLNSVPLTLGLPTNPLRIDRLPCVTTAHGARVRISPVAVQIPNVLLEPEPPVKKPGSDSESVIIPLCWSLTPMRMVGCADTATMTRPTKAMVTTPAPVHGD